MIQRDRVIAVLTAVNPDTAEHLPDAWQSLLAQELPVGWSWRWVVHQDGPGPAVARAVPSDPRVDVQVGRKAGVASARNLALGRALDSDLCRVLDADDQLTPGALARDIAVMTARPSSGWTTSRVLDLWPDGSTEGFPHDPEEGPIERGAVYAHWAAHNYRAQVHPTTLCVRTALLTEVGGWTGLPASEDTGLLLTLDAVSPGYFAREPGVLYRKWPGQMTASAEHIDPDERRARMDLIGARARLLRSPSRVPDHARTA